MMKKLIKKFIPKRVKEFLTPYRKQLRNFKTLALEYAQLKTIKEWECVDKKGNPIPWFTYPAIEYLNHLDLSEMSVFEYGSGYSTMYWLSRARKVISIEHDPRWFESVKARSKKYINGDNFEYHLATKREDDYVNIVDKYEQCFNIYVIDGIYRKSCAQKIVEHIKLYGGDIVIFDNSDWYPNAIRFIRENLDWIEIDFHGFSPINDYTLTTTIFLNRDVKLKYLLPLHSVKGIIQVGEDDES